MTPSRRHTRRARAVLIALAAWCALIQPQLSFFLLQNDYAMLFNCARCAWRIEQPAIFALAWLASAAISAPGFVMIYVLGRRIARGET